LGKDAIQTDPAANDIGSDGKINYNSDGSITLVRPDGSQIIQDLQKD
jgi:hypothetical protein